MLEISITRGLLLAGLSTPFFVPTPSFADFFEDSKATLELRNFYFNRDFRQDTAAQSYTEEWAQGFKLRYESGFTEGTVGFGLDVIGLLGVKLDTGRGRAGVGLLNVHNDGDVPSDYGKIGPTFKMRFSNSVLRYGTLTPRIPTVMTHDLRLLTQIFRGTQLTSEEIEGLTLNIGRLTRNSQRNWSASEKITSTNRGMTGLKETDKFDFAGMTYQWTKNLTTGYNYANLDDNYHQHFFTLTHTLPITEGQSVKTDLRFSRSSDDGDSNVDNRTMSAMFTYRLQGHAFGLAYQKLTGATGFPFIAGSDPYVPNYFLTTDFTSPNERSWQLRYDYNFAAVGIPGLTFMTRYARGDNFRRADGSNGREWARDMDLGYVIQTGPLKNLGLLWRNGILRNNGNGVDINEDRLIISYTIPLL
ncbi:OprD family porin [Azomonas macrocytogenes]|uniref:Uncharacterized protein n=1 Tax=Azomonas macrocytogenes TaxID=69962 RepID=A0A839T4V0_AZOMA|nr:OprD family porin [Azomonas macrocytogenes]MBB3104108.1 hypothetical protein [Azomonas macrocytogenes]